MYNPPEHQASWQEAGSPSSQQRSLYGRQFPPGHQEFSENISSFAMKTQSMVLPDTPDSTEEAFRLINAGVEAEEDRRFAAAMRHFLDAGEMLTRVGEQEPDQHVRNLLHQKAMDVLGWTEALANWTDNGRVGPVPRRMGRCVAADVIHRLSPSVHAPVLPTDTLEFRTMYYTAVSTKRVDDFTRDGYVLKTIQYGRRPKLMVVITMYNEDENELAFTLRKVANNVQYIQQMKLPGYQDDNAWQNVLVCIVSDGRTKANKGTLSWLNKTGAFDEEAMTINSVGTDVQMHLFEYSMQLLHHKVSRGVGGGVRIEEKNERYPPLQVVFALKEYNGGKLNSHEWYFNAFAEQVMPKYTILLDVGTMPTKSAFYRLLAAMEGNPKIGGVCGEIAVDRPIPNLCNFVIAAQHYEYKVSNILDKSMESVFGFISVLPGAFSAYRYEAIRGEPLRAYFKSLTTSMKELGPFQGNMYLAEDRILCFEIVAKANCKWTLHYVKNAIARTDVPTNLVALIGQRRRWLNGSFFAILYTVAFWGRIYSESGHSYFRKAAFMVQYTYNCITVLLNWLLVGNFYLAIYFVVIRAMYNNSYPEFMKVDEFPTKWKDLISNLFQFSYAVIFLLQILAGLGNKPKHIPWIYTVAAAYFGLVMAVAFVVATLIFIFQDTFSSFTIIFAIAIVGVYFIAAALHCEVHHIFMTILQYFAMLPTMINILNVYSFCNLHDLSWGTKGLDSGGGHGPKAGDKKGTYEDVVAAQKAAEEKARKEAAEKDMLEKQFNGFRLKLLFLWLLSNMAFVFAVQLYVDANSYLTVLYVVIGAFNVWRLIGSAAYLVTYLGDKLYALLFLRRRLRKEDIREREMRYRASVQAHRQMGGPGAPPPGGYQIFETPLSKEPQLQP